MINGRFKITFGHFFANYMNFFNKTEVQTAILRWKMGLNFLFGSNVMTKMKKHAKTQKRRKPQKTVLLQNCKKTKTEIFAFCVITIKSIKI